MRPVLRMSILFATIAVPIGAASDSDPRRGLRKAIFRVVLFDALYLVACAFLYSRLP